MQRRVLHLVAGNLYGGVERALVQFCRGLGDARPAFASDVALCFQGRLSTELEATDGAVFDLGAVSLRQPWTLLAARRKLAAVLRDERYDAVLTHGCWPHALFAPVVRKVARQLKAEDGEGPALLFFAHNLLSGLPWTERLAALSPPDLVVANSRGTQATARAVFGKVPAAVVHPPVERPRRATTAKRQQDRRAVRTEMGTRPDAVVLLMASRLEAGKGHAVLLDALARLKDDRRWVLWLAGGVQRPAEERLRDRLRDFAKNMGVFDRTVFAGERCDLPRLYSAADVFCQPNTAPESFGMTFVEAMAAGLPVVTTAVGGGAEVVTSDTGRLVPANDPQALADALRQLIHREELRRELGENGPTRAADLCDPARQCDALGAALLRACRGTDKDKSKAARVAEAVEA